MGRRSSPAPRTTSTTSSLTPGARCSWRRSSMRSSGSTSSARGTCSGSPPTAPACCPAGSIGPDLVHRLAGEASEIAEHFLHICIRALDYCPPNDITFGSYLRALVTADLDIAPEDENGYRVALIEAFRARGIFPRGLNTLSIESLCWNRPDFTQTAAGSADLSRRRAQAAHHRAGRDQRPEGALRAIDDGAGGAEQAADGQAAPVSRPGLGALSQRSGPHVAARCRSCSARIPRRSVSCATTRQTKATRRRSSATPSGRRFAPAARIGKSNRSSSR